MKILKLLGKFFSFKIRVENKYDKIKNDDTKREKSISLGVRCIVTTILCALVASLFVVGLYYCWDKVINVNISKDSYSFPFLSILGMVVCGICTVILFVEGFVEGLVYMIYQFKLNKRAIRWVALAVWIIALIVFVAFAILCLSRL